MGWNLENNMLYISKIISLFEHGNYDEVISLCRNAISIHPSLYIYHEYLVRALVAVAKYQDAIVATRDGLKINPHSIHLKAAKMQLQQHVLSNDYASVGAFERLPLTEHGRNLEMGIRTSANGLKVKTADIPRVSVITALYNNPISIERCINSILSQTYTNIEHIIIDGGSDESTLEIIRRYAENIDYIVSEPDKGIYDAMNKGIRAAQGDYVCLLNSDDAYDVTHIAKLVEATAGSSSQVIYTNFKVDGKKVLSSNEIGQGIYLGNLNCNHATFLVPKQVYNAVGLYDLRYNIISDIDWIKRAFELGIKFKKIEEYTFNFYSGGASSGVSQLWKERMHREISEFYQIEFPFLTFNDCLNIYNFRFNARFAEPLFEIAVKFSGYENFIHSLTKYINDCVTLRDNFKLSYDEINNFKLLVKLYERLGLSVTNIRIETSKGCFSDITKSFYKIISTANRRKQNNAKVLLNYVFQFSTPSETFIYDFINRYNQEGVISIVLCDVRILEKERPSENVIVIDWASFRPEIRNELYKFIFSNLDIDLVVSHFAINDRKLKQRINPLGINPPTIAMTHGIDVFTLKENRDYRDFVAKHYGKHSPNRLTTVSNYLYSKLLENGIPSYKIDLIHNVANCRFLERHKTIRNFDKLNILSIGRCIEWKGHDDLINAVSLLNQHYNIDTQATIVYGSQDGCLSSLQDLVTELGLENHISFIDFIDFNEHPDFHSNFNFYVQASKYSSDVEPRTETFGVAVLEAIYAGLPVVVTDAGGLPEVVGNNLTFARIAKADDPSDLAKNIACLFSEQVPPVNNFEYASSRAEFFSEERQRVLFTRSISKVIEPKCRVAIFSSNTTKGAGYAAYRVLQSLRFHSLIEPALFTHDKSHRANAWVKVLEHPNSKKNNWRFFQSTKNSHEGLTIFTNNEPILENKDLEALVADYDIINLHWTARFISVENLAYLSWLDKPVVLTIRDMFYLTGGCHYFHGCENWQSTCKNCPQLIDDISGFPSKVLDYKKSQINFSNITIVVLSNHSRKIVEKSIFKQCRIELIPNSIEVSVFKQDKMAKVRTENSISETTKVIGFVPSFQSDVKGFEEAIEVLNRLYDDNDYDKDTLILLLGDSKVAAERIKFPSLSAGFINDNAELAKHYSAMDILLVPSKEETFSNTTAESISCGTPVLGFATGAIPDLAIEGLSGCSVPIGDIDAMFQKLKDYLLGVPLDRVKIRKFATDMLRMENQGKAYQELFYELRDKAKVSLPIASARSKSLSIDYSVLNSLLSDHSKDDA